MAETQRYRVVWVNEPTTEAVVAWEQVAGASATVHYGKKDMGQNAAAYSHSQKVSREQNYHDMRNCFARLKGLEPDTRYYFVIKDGDSTSRRLYFTTAPKEQKPFAFVAGGDSRNFRKPRQAANQLVAKLQPLFVAFTGDMINIDNSKEWQVWLDDWQLTIREDGRVTPIVPHRGNHESGGNQTIYHLFDTTPDNFYAFSVGGRLFRYYVLNSEMPEGGVQAEWLKKDLEVNAAKVRHLTAGYHKPMRPHVRAKSEGTGEYDAWAQMFYHFGMDVVFESDSHTIKRTHPLKPDLAGDEGFSIANGDKNATIYTGEGCWGAPLRRSDDLKSWTLAAKAFNGFDWVIVKPSEIEVRTVMVDQEASVGWSKDPLKKPQGLQCWEPESGEVLRVPGD